MKVFVLSVAVALLMAVAAAYWLDSQQVLTTDAFQTPGVRLGNFGIAAFGLR